MVNQLSLATTYQLRRLLHQNLDRLTSIVAEGAGLKADPLSDLNCVLESLYLEDSEINHAVNRLEHFVSLHQSLNQQGAKHRQELRKVEQDIFWLLGFKFIERLTLGTVLIVDDTLMNLKLLSKALETHGYETHCASNGLEALNLAKEVCPDLILLDIMMPGIDGYEVCDRLKTNLLTSNIPVLFISTMNDAIDKVRAFDIGGVDYVTKPFQSEEVLARIAHHINLRNLQKRLEAQNIRLQQESQERYLAEVLYRNLFENALCGIFQSTLEGQYLRVNQALAEIYGYDSPEAMLASANTTNLFYVEPNRYTELMSCVQQHEIVRQFESQVYDKSGNKLWISESVRKVSDQQGNLLFYEGTVQKVIHQRTECEPVLCTPD